MNMPKQIKNIIIFLTLIACFSPNKVFAESAPYPEPPSQETLDKWKEMGRQNEILYGSGNTTVVSPTAPVTTAPTPSSTLSPSPSPSPSILSPNPESSDYQLEDLPNKKFNLLQIIRNFFKNLGESLIPKFLKENK